MSMQAGCEKMHEPAAHPAPWPFAPSDANAVFPPVSESQLNLERILQTTRSYFGIATRAKK